MGKYYLTILILCNIWVNAIFAQHITYYEVLDAAEANKIFNALKTDSTDNKAWPIPEGRVLSTELNALGWDYYNDFVTIEYVDLDDNTTLVKTKIRDIYLGGSNLSGTIPPVQLDSLRYLEVGWNNITGIDPNIKLPELRSIRLQFTNLGSFPELPFPKIRTIDLYRSNIKGEIKHLSLNELTFLDISENQLEGTISLNCPELDYLGADENMFSGTLLNINAPKLRWLDIGSNKYEGIFDINPSPSMVYLSISDNQFEGISPSVMSKLPILDNFFCGSNKLQFGDLEVFTNKVMTHFSYSPQFPLALIIEKGIEKQSLTTKVSGNKNKYQWFFVPKSSPLRLVNVDSIGLYTALYLSFGLTENVLEALENSTEKQLLIDLNEDPWYYACLITNESLPKLKLASVVLNPEPKNCWENEYFSFCFIEDEASWGPGENKNEIAATKPLSINGFLNFEGTITIDTVKLSVKSNGKFFIKDIPLPGGGTGDFTLASGEYELSLLGEGGRLTGFVNDALSTFTPNIGGLDLKLEDLQLIGGRSAQGISLNLQISWDNITPSCGSGSDQTTAIKLQGLSIVKGKGINVDGMEVSDMGIAPGFCLKELKASYDQDNDKLAFGLTLLTPFIEVGGGLGLIHGEIDSVAMRAVLQDKIIPLGTTGIGIIGCEGRVNKITEPPVNAKFGGIISAVVSDNIFQLTTSLEYIPPAILKVELGDGKFFNPPFADGWWLGEGGVYGQIDLKTYKVKLGGELKLSPYLDASGNKKHMATGKIDLAYRNAPITGVTVGQLEGAVTIPKLSNKWPYDWLNSKLGLPYNINGNALLVYKSTTKYITGELNLGGRIGKVNYDINLAKNYNEPGFFSFQAQELSSKTSKNGREEIFINIPENVPLAVLSVYGFTHASTLSLSDPGGSTITTNQPGENAEWLSDGENEKGYLTLYHPVSGSWNISINNADSISWHLFGEQYAFSIETELNDNGVLVKWDKNLFSSGGTVDIFLDDDNSNMDGSWLTEVNGNNGSYLIPFDDVSEYCNFYVMGIADRNGQRRTAYSAEYIYNPIDSYEAPQNIDWTYDNNSSELIIDWSIVTESNLAGYILEYRKDSIVETLAMLAPTENHYQTIIEDFNPQNILFYSFGLDGESSCPVYLENSTSVEETTLNKQIEDLRLLKLFPNPSSSEVIIAFNAFDNKVIQIELMDMMGKVMFKQSNYKVHEGQNHYRLNIEHLIPGQYLINVQGEQSVYTPTALIKL